VSAITTPRLCYLVMSHTDADMVERAVRVLQAETPRSRVVIRHDAKVRELPARRFADLSDVEVSNHMKPSTWGSWDLTERMIEGIDLALRGDKAWEWLVILSGQSYPLSPPAQFAAGLGKVDAAAVLHLARPQDQGAATFRHWRPFGADRARYRYRPLPPLPVWQYHRVRRPLLALTARQPLGGFSFHRPSHEAAGVTAQWVSLRRSAVFSRAVHPLKASQWAVLGRVAAETVVTMLNPVSRWRQQLQETFTSDELAVPSILAARGLPLADAPLHAMRWPSGPSPAVLDAADRTWLLHCTEPFTRKVSSSVSRDLLDQLDEARHARAARRTDRLEEEGREES
jgi:hypothetical protein